MAWAGNKAGWAGNEASLHRMWPGLGTKLGGMGTKLVCTEAGGCVPVWSGWGRRRVMGDGDCAGWKVLKHYYSIKVCGRGLIFVT